MKFYILLPIKISKAVANHFVSITHFIISAKDSLTRHQASCFRGDSMNRPTYLSVVVCDFIIKLVKREFCEFILFQRIKVSSKGRISILFILFIILSSLPLIFRYLSNQKQDNHLVLFRNGVYDSPKTPQMNQVHQ